MAAEKDSSCHNNCINDPNFAIICSFFDRFASSCGITHPTFFELQEMIENTQEVVPELIDLHVKLLRKIRRSVAAEKWERALIKFCHSYFCNEDGWELERGGYKKCKIPARLRILKTLLDAQFDLNSKFKTDINKLSAEELRLEPLGRDKVGQSYWCQFDAAANVRVYKEDQDEETWKLVAKDREGLVDLITQLSSGEELLGLELINEDSNSQEVEKPIIDTGQVEISTSEENTADNISSVDINIENNVKNEGQLSSNTHSENELCVEEKSNNAPTKNQSDHSNQKSFENGLKESSKETSESDSKPFEDNDCSKSVPNPESESLQTNNDKSNLMFSNLEPNELTEENLIQNCNAAKENETDENKSLSTETDNNYSCQVSKTDNIDVTEEIKQRSLVKSNSLTLFKGKNNKTSSVSKLDQIFSHKLESKNIISTDSSKSIIKPIHMAEEEQLLKVPDTNQLKEDEKLFDKVTITNLQLLGDSDKKRKELEFENSMASPYKKQCLATELSDEVGEEIKEPVMLIKGEGSGQNCETGNYLIVNKVTETFSEEFGEEIEEPLMVFKGEGYGHDCDTGNPSREEDEEDVETTEKINIVKSGENNLKSIANEHHKTILDSHQSGNENCNNNGRIANSDVNTCTVEKNDENRVNVLNDIYETNVSCELNEKICKDNETLNVNNKLEDSKRGIHNLNSSHSDVEHEQSIEEQLSFLTGESLSPQHCNETECNEGNNSHSQNHVSDKGVRRKSIENTKSTEDKDIVPPEPKKTKVGKDIPVRDIFDCLNTNSNQSNDIIDTLMDKQDNPTDKPNVEELTISNTEIANDATSEQENDNITSEGNLIEKNNSSTLITIQSSDREKKNYKITGNDKKTNKVNNIKNTSCRPAEVNNSEGKNLVEEVTSSQDNSELHESPVVSSNAIDSEPIPTVLDKETMSCVNVTSNILPVADNGNLNLEKMAESNVNDKPSETEKESKNETKLLNSENDIEESSDSSILKSDKNIKTISKKPTQKKSPKPRKKIFTPKSRKKVAKIPKNHSKNETITENSPESKETVQSKKKGVKKEDINQKSSEEKQDTAKNLSKIEIIENAITQCDSVVKENRKRRSSRRNTGTEKDSEEDAMSDIKEDENKEDAEELVGGKRRKIKGKRAPNKSLRKSVEEKRKSNSSSEEESQLKDNDKQNVKKSPLSSKEGHGKGKNTNKNNEKKNTTMLVKKKKEGDEASNETEEIIQANKKSKSSKSLGRNSRAFLGIDLNIDINETSRSVRQSSRLAQIKIKEQADHKIVDESLKRFEKSTKKSPKKKAENEEKQKGTPKKHKKAKTDASEDDIPEEDLAETKKRKKKKKKNPVKAFNERDPWKSSSGSSTEAEEEEEEYHFDDIVEEEEDVPVAIKSDHEFSPESDLEGDDEVKPIRHARTAQKVSDPSTEEGDVDDFACEKCGKKDHPEWILLCDTCDHGWHASCLRPSLMLIPEGDWHCPTCQHAILVKKLQETLKIFDRDSKRRENEELRKKRLAYVGISLDNVLPSNVHAPHPRESKEKVSASESSESSESESRSESEESDEPVYQLRQRRQGTNTYRFSEFDDLINSAIQDEVAGKHAVFGIAPESVTPSENKVEETPCVTESKGDESNKPLGLEENKPITSSDVSENKEEKEQINEPMNKIKDKSDGDEESSSENEDNEDDEEEEFPHVVPKRINILPRRGKKKHRRLNCLDDASDDDDGSDEDFKGSSSEEEDEDDEEDDSDESGTGRRKSKRGHIGPVRRSSRTRRSRFDKEFINDDSEESDAPRKKKTRKLWSDSDSESDDSTWGRRKKKKNQGSSGRRKFRKNKQFVIEDELSETETSKTPKKKRQRKIKYGGLDDLAVEDLPSRRTRGKKINYQEVLGSDSDEEIQKPKSVKRAIIIDDEFVAEKEGKEDSESSSGEDDEGEENSCDEQNKEEKTTDKRMMEIENQEKGIIKTKVPPLEEINKGTIKRVKAPKAMIAPPPERLVSEDEQYKAIVSKVSTLAHSEKPMNESDINLSRPTNFNDHSNSSSESKDFAEYPHHLTPIKNSSNDQKFIKRSPPIKIRSGVPVNSTGRRSPLASPTNELSFFPVKQNNLEQVHSPPDIIHSPPRPQKAQGLIQASAQQFVSTRKSINPIIKTEKLANEEIDNPVEDDYLDDIEEEEEDDEDDSEDDLLEEGEIPKKVARKMARMEEQMLRQQEVRKPVQPAASLSPGPVQPLTNMASEQKSTQPLLRVVSPLKLMANPPGPLQSSFIHSGIATRMPLSSPPGPSRMAMAIRPPQPAGIMPGIPVDDGSPKRRGRGRGKKQPEKPDPEMMGGGSVIRGMLQQPQSYPPTHYPQQYPPHPRIPFNPQRMPRPPFHPGHHPLDPSPSGGGTISVKQEPAANKAPPRSTPPYHPPSGPPHRFDSGHQRQPSYPPQPPKPQYNSYPPPPGPTPNYHYGTYPPPPPAPPQGYPVQQPYSEQYPEQPAPSTAPTSEDSGEFGGLVSYFSSQREEQLDT